MKIRGLRSAVSEYNRIARASYNQGYNQNTYGTIWFDTETGEIWTSETEIGWQIMRDDPAVKVLAMNGNPTTMKAIKAAAENVIG